MGVSEHLTRDLMARAVAEFDENPLCGQLMRRLANEIPDQFCAAALEYLESNQQTNAHRFLSILMQRQPSIFDQLMNPVYGSRQRSVHLLKRLLDVDPSFDLKLARRLPDRPGAYSCCDSRSAARALEILERPPRGGGCCRFWDTSFTARIFAYRRRRHFWWGGACKIRSGRRNN